MEKVMMHGPAPNTFGRCIKAQATSGWAESPVLFLLTCYDVWSATPPRGCDPATADATAAAEEAGAEA